MVLFLRPVFTLSLTCNATSQALLLFLVSESAYNMIVHNSLHISFFYQMSSMPVMPGFSFYYKYSNLFIWKASGTWIKIIFILAWLLSVTLYIDEFSSEIIFFSTFYFLSLKLVFLITSELSWHLSLSWIHTFSLNF